MWGNRRVGHWFPLREWRGGRVHFWDALLGTVGLPLEIDSKWKKKCAQFKQLHFDRSLVAVWPHFGRRKSRFFMYLHSFRSPAVQKLPVGHAWFLLTPKKNHHMLADQELVRVFLTGNCNKNQNSFKIASFLLQFSVRKTRTSSWSASMWWFFFGVSCTDGQFCKSESC